MIRRAAGVIVTAAPTACSLQMFNWFTRSAGLGEQSQVGLLRQAINGGTMEYWGSKTDDGLILISDPSYHDQIRPYSAKPSIPAFQYSIIPSQMATAQPIISDLAQIARFPMLEQKSERLKRFQRGATC